MKEIRLTKNFVMYQFDPEGERVLGQNIFVLYHDDECIVFDAGYECHMAELKPTLDKYDIKHVILTHFHPDHCYGLNELSKQNVIGSVHYIDTLTIFNDFDNELLIPAQTVDSTLSLDFYDHRIKIINNPGHSICGLAIIIDDEFVLVGDDILSTNDNNPVLPFIAYTIDSHESSLNVIKNLYSSKVLLPSHGSPLYKNQISELDKRLNYIKFLKTKEKNIDVLHKKIDYTFENPEWHSFNVNNTKKAN